MMKTTWREEKKENGESKELSYAVPLIVYSRYPIGMSEESRGT